jgi:hypothetical protein
LLPEIQSPSLKANSQFTNNESSVLRKRKKGLLFVRQRKGQGESASQSTVVPLLRENVYLLKGHPGVQLDCMTICMPTKAGGLDLLGVWCHFSEAVCLGWQVYCSGGQREIRARELLDLIGEQRELIFVTGFSSID